MAALSPGRRTNSRSRIRQNAGLVWLCRLLTNAAIVESLDGSFTHGRAIFAGRIDLRPGPRLRVGAERAAFLDRVCGNNQALRAEVEALLRAHEQSGNLLDLPDNLATTKLQDREGTGTVIGPYKLLEQIGEGGMGSVWMAQQTEPIERRVAVKVVKEGMDSRQVVARFEAERQALALMEHPNIAKVLDAGRTPSGRPYFVMELVKGKPITYYCDEKRLGVRDRLELFGEVCRAVQHAHQRGIIHRDLKPSNVLAAPYDGKPVVKVIDFGVAKATGQRLTDKTLFTGFGALVGTPEYMSPEQAEVNNQDIDTRSDIYSLGVLLYELLTGSTPLTRKRLKETALLEVLRVIREEEPPRPSTRLSESKDTLPSISAQRQTEPATLTKLLRGELDWIVMKALEKDRNRRYETANDLAQDIQRYLHDEPVEACPPAAWYRFRKFARRNKAVLAAAAAVAVAAFLAVGTLAGAVKVLADNNTEIKEKQQQTSDALRSEKRARQDLQKSLDREACSSYYRSVQLAQSELAANNIGRAEELLDDCPLKLRGWEWHYLKRRPYGPLTFHARSRVVFSPDGKRLAWVSEHGQIALGDRKTGWKASRLLGDARKAIWLAFSPDGKRLASAGWDRTIRVWDVSAGKEVGSQSGHADAVAALAFSPDGKLLASASWDHTVIVWDAATFQQLRTLRGHTRGVNGIAFAANGRLASAGSDGTVRVWDPNTGRELHTLRGHSGPVMDVACARDGRLASAGFDGSIKLWDAASGQHLATIRADITPFSAWLSARTANVLPSAAWSAPSASGTWRRGRKRSPSAGTKKWSCTSSSARTGSRSPRLAGLRRCGTRAPRGRAPTRSRCAATAARSSAWPSCRTVSAWLRPASTRRSASGTPGPARNSTCCGGGPPSPWRGGCTSGTQRRGKRRSRPSVDTSPPSPVSPSAPTASAWPLPAWTARPRSGTR